MILSCKCLNIQFETKNEPIKFDKCSLGDSYNSHFFSKDLLCCEVFEITKRQDCLIREERVYGWITYECLNCDILCYAEPTDKDIAATILISPELLMNQKQINDLQSSDCFSPIYEIVINCTDDSNLMYSRSSAVLPPKIKALHLQMSEKIDNETKRVEEKIRKFTEDQYSALDEFTTKADKDFKTLARIITDKDKVPKFENLPARTGSKKVSSQQMLPKPIITTLKNNPVTNSMDFTFEPYTKENENDVSSKANLIKVPLVGGSNDSGLPRASYDAEGLFPLEDLDNLQNDCVSDDDLSESEGESGSHDEGIYIPHHKQLEVASSLPINVPKFMVNSGSVPIDVNSQIPVGRESENKTDIAASIRTLAKIVHGDRIFGELPRPRLGSQI